MLPELITLLAVLAVLAVAAGIAVRRARRKELERVREKEALPAPRPEARPRLEPVPPPEEETPPEAAEEEAAEEEAAEEEAAEEEAAEEEAAEEERRRALKAGLKKTRGGFIARLGEIFSNKKNIDEDLMEQIEEVLFTADIGVKTSQKLFEELKKDLSRDELKDASALWAHLEEETTRILDVDAPPLDLERAHPFVILVIGVNGVGKTTTIGKLAAKYAAMGKKVLLAAGDTFRAAATEQLEIWGQRTGCPVVKGKEGGDPSSVIFDAIKTAEKDGYDVVIADTAGRLHTKTDLMEELKKVRRVTHKAKEGAPHETFLVLDATTGQNAITQAQLFKQAMEISGIVLTKLDGTAKGGVILGICDELRVPVRYVGVGEKVEDLREFDARDFVAALYARDEDARAA